MDQAEKIMGIKRRFPSGSCFDAVCLTLASLLWNWEGKDVTICHGIGTANEPGQEGLEIAHAWIEVDGDAYDCIWGLSQRADIYRRNLQVTHLVEYPSGEFLRLWKEKGMPGPWDPKILEVAERK